MKKSEKIIKGLSILQKYSTKEYNTWAEHDIFGVMEIETDDVSEEDKKELESVGWFFDKEYDAWAIFT